MSSPYTNLYQFVSNRMRMSHVYQPVMLMTLLENGGSCTVKDIARAILAHDQSQLEYYQKITNQMPGRVLRNHDIVTKQGKSYRLNGNDELTDDQRQHLIDLCQSKLDEYIAKRGERIWQHRKLSNGYVSGTLRYEVFKRAKFRCELCGCSAEEKALEVDHIIPRNKGGTDDIENLQALCYSCNAMKRDRDDTDFRAIRESYKHREPGCLFCEIPEERIIAENSLAYAIRDGYPVTEHHTLIIPKRHIAEYFELGRPEINACNELMYGIRKEVLKLDSSVTGFNIGMNAGEDAGQTIFHCHIHLIPRRKGDVENPRGGVRHVIAGKGYY